MRSRELAAGIRRGWRGRRGAFLALAAWLLWLAGCGRPPTLPAAPPPTLLLPAVEAPTAPVPTTAVPTIAPIVPDSGWSQLRPGLERRVINLLDEQGAPEESLYLLRLVPALFRFGVAYHPGQPQGLHAWQVETGALIVLNGGFFTPEFQATGRIVADGQGTGQSYGADAGMFAVTAAGPEVRWLGQQPYDPSEPLLAAVQAFPMLLRPGGLPLPAEEGRATARRTVVAQDRQGRLLFLVAGWGKFSLPALAHFLAQSDLDLDMALNLDGGPSSGLLLAEPAEGVPSFVALPAVIAVYPASPP